MAGSATRPSADRIETVVVDPADVLEAFERNRDAETERERHVLRVSPPFDETVTARRRVLEADPETAADADLDPDAAAIHLGPEAFVHVHGEYDPRRTRIPVPTREESRSVARSDHDGAVDEETVDSYHTRAMNAWRECVRTSLVDEVPLQSDADAGTELWAAVRYEER